MSTAEERAYINQKLMPELRKQFELWAKEYQQERDLGALGEFANLYRKARKLKTLMWPGQNKAHGMDWREPQRVIVGEVVAHGLLLLLDLDRESGDFQKWIAENYSEPEEDDDEEDELPIKRPRTQTALQRRAATVSPMRAGPTKED